MSSVSGWMKRPSRSRPGIDEKVYGKPSGVLGFRLFPNPEFDAEARKKWDGERFMNDPGYYNNNKLVRPYRVGVSCGSCHIAPHPDQSAGRSGESALGKSRLRDRQSIHPRRESVCPQRGERRLLLRNAPGPAARHLRHLAHRDGSHQQSERDQCHLPSGRARAHSGAGETWPAARSPSRARKRRCRWRAFSRMARTPSACRARPFASTSTSGCFPNTG